MFNMLARIFPDKATLSLAAADQAATAIRRAIDQKGGARIVAATAASQIDFLDALTRAPGIDWRAVEVFHLDEYIGLPITHPGSFRGMLLQQLISKTGITNYHLLDGDTGDPAEVAQRVGTQLGSAPIDIEFLGIGENGHLAFNDPPADFDTEKPYIVVELDEACRRQQVGEGWFASLDDVPKQAISISIKQILKAREIVCIVPDARKAQAVRNCFENEVSPQFPASILRTHANTVVYLDPESASLLNPNTISKQ